MSSAPDTSNFYAAPAAHAEPPAATGDLDALVESTGVTPLVITGAGVVALAGTVLALAGVQLWLNFELRGVFTVIPWVMLGLGVAHLGIAVKLLRLRSWAAYAGFALGIVSALASIAWFLFAAATGLFTLYGVMLPFLGAASAVLSFLAITPARAATAARRRLDAQGLSTDF